MTRNRRRSRRQLTSFEIACRRADRAARQVFRDEERTPLAHVVREQHSSVDTDRHLAAS